MSIQLVAAALLVLFMLGLWVMVYVLTSIKSDEAAMYPLFSVRDQLIRMVVNGQVERFDPHFDAIYRNVNILLTASHSLCGPEGWGLAHRQGQLLARYPRSATPLTQMPRNDLPESILPVMDTLKPALWHLLKNHLGVFTQIDSQRRELRKIQKERARAFLEMMPQNVEACAG